MGIGAEHAGSWLDRLDGVHGPLRLSKKDAKSRGERLRGAEGRGIGARCQSFPHCESHWFATNYCAADSATRAWPRGCASVTRFSFVGALYVVLCASAATAQSVSDPACTASSDDYLTCALRAGGIRDLRDVNVGDDERELRFWTVSGYFMPDQVLIIHQWPDSVNAQLLLIWTRGSETSTLATSTCGERWPSPNATMCRGHFERSTDWLTLLRQLDALAIGDLPAMPVGEQRCDRTPLPPLHPGYLPRDRICAYPADGFSNTLELRTARVYWRYAFSRLPDTTARGFARDTSLLRLLTCAARKRGDGPC